MDSVKAAFLGKSVDLLIDIIKDEADGGLIEDLGDMIIDWAEKKVLGTASKIDDALVLPVCKGIRFATGWEDDDTDQLNPV